MKSRRRSLKEVIVDHLSILTNEEIKDFLKRKKLAVKSTKEDLRRVVKEALSSGDLEIAEIVEFLDEVTPWGKQHVYLYNGPSTPTTTTSAAPHVAKRSDWRDQAWVLNHLKANNLLEVFNTPKTDLVLPKTLELKEIEWTTQKLRVTAVRRREGWVRDEELDRPTKSPDGRPATLRGFVHQVLRGIIAFEWNLVSNEAFLQITQLPTKSSYEKVAAEFMASVDSWLPFTGFTKLDLQKGIKKIHEQEELGTRADVSQYGHDD